MQIRITFSLPYFKYIGGLGGIDAGLGGVGDLKGIKTHNCKKVFCLLIIKNKETLYLVVVLS